MTIVRNNGDDIPRVSRIKTLFDSKYSTELIPTSQFHEFDLKDALAKVVIEVKKLNCNHDKYPKLIMGYNKYIKARQYITRGYQVYFIIEYLDGTYSHKYDNEAYLPVKSGRRDRGYYEEKDYVFIPRSLIVPF